MRWAALVVMVCGCGRLGFEPRIGADTGTDGGTGDGTTAVDGPGDVSTAACTAPGSGSTFPGGAPCANWGATPTAFNAGLEEAGGVLSITPTPNTAGALGGCTRTGVPFGAGGAIVQIESVLAGDNTLTAMQLGSGPTALSIAVSGGALLAQDASGTRAMVPFDLGGMRYWRVRAGTSGIVFEYTGNGVTWTVLGTSAQTPQATYDFQIVAGELAAAPTPGVARFASVNLCP